MRLLNVKTLDFEEFVGNSAPSYAIFSHTWGAEEVSYRDYVDKQSLLKSGYSKIHSCCRLADSEGFQYVWVDTCCIDKSSSAELSESINSMFQWYRDAGICYAYLNDVSSSENPKTEESSFARSRWFTRGWTLQELLAPAEVVFLGSDWVEIGTKKSLRDAVSRITRISQTVLDESHWTEYSVAQKMSWAAGRCTTRLEDEAYCLMGLFDVNMPLLYGEGRKAFWRLQQEILKQSDDQSIFAWSYPEEEHGYTQISGLIAPSPEYFRDASRIELLGREHGEDYENPFQVVNRLIRVRLRLVDQVKAIRLQQLLNKPPLYNIVEIQHGGERGQGGQSTPSSAPDLQREESIKEEVPIIQTRQQLPTPAITITIQDTDTQPVIEEPMAPPESARKITEDVEVYSGLPSFNITDTSGVDYEIFDSNLEPAIPKIESPEAGGPVGPESWRWYIYDPVIIVPLRCHINGHRLGILFSKGSIDIEGKVLSRLHNPSIVGTKAVRESRRTPLMTVYANIFTSANSRLNEFHDPEPRPWPDIRISSLISAGYSTNEYYGRGWSLDRTKGFIVQTHKFGVEFDMSNFAPFVFFYRTDATFSAFFVSLPTCASNDLICEIGIAGRSPSTALDYSLYSFNLARDRRGEVPLRSGQALVAKYREGSSSYVTISIETLNGDTAASPVSYDMAKKGMINLKLFPLLRSLR